MRQRAMFVAILAYSSLALAQEGSAERDIGMDWSKLLNTYQRLDRWISATDSVSQSSLMFADAMGGETKSSVYYCVHQYGIERSVLAPMRDQSTARAAATYNESGQDPRASGAFLDGEQPLASELLSTAERISKSAWRCLSQNGVRVDLLLESYQDLHSSRDG